MNIDPLKSILCLLRNLAPNSFTCTGVEGSCWDKMMAASLAIPVRLRALDNWNFALLTTDEHCKTKEVACILKRS